MICQIFYITQLKKWAGEPILLKYVNMFGNTTNKSFLILEIYFILGNMIYAGQLQS